MALRTSNIFKSIVKDIHLKTIGIGRSSHEATCRGTLTFFSVVTIFSIYIKFPIYNQHCKGKVE